MRLPRLLRSTTARIFGPIAIVQMLAAGSLIGFVWITGQSELRRQDSARVDELHADFMSDVEDGGLRELTQVIALRIRNEGARAPIMLLLDPKGRRIIGNLDHWQPPQRTAGTVMWLALTRAGSTYPEDVVVRETRFDDGTTLIAGWSTEDERQLRQGNQRVLLIALLLSVPLALLVSVLISRSIARRIQHLAETAHRVETGALHVRVPIDESGDSFDRLGQQINRMLDRIEGLVIELRLVTDGLAHDLRSPVTRLKSVIERALAETDEPAAVAALERAASEADSLIAMLGTALQITRAEAGIGREAFLPTDIAEYLSDLAELYAPLAEDCGFALTVDAAPGLVIPLHREMVGQAIGNLVDNALKYAHGGDSIAIAAEPDPDAHDEIAIRVCDNGPGIPEEMRAEALKRFGRLDPARGVAGSGLGLALAGTVARLHGGDITLGDAQPGLCVRLRLASH